MKTAIAMAFVTLLAILMIYGVGHHARYLDNHELLHRWQKHF